MKKNFISALEKLLKEHDISYRELPGYAELLLRKDPSCIQTPCPIVYLSDGALTEKNYLDLSLKESVWGIKSGGLYWCKDTTIEIPSNKVDDVMKKDTLANLELFCPNKIYFRKMAEHIDDFAKTVEILNAHGISASSWDDEHYWTGLESSVVGKLSYSMTSNELHIEEADCKLKARFAIIP